ncbi:hypothetical protein [Niemeyer virus]|uniref:Uncharacterized protein n=1 Tax=Acanthamoeba polyphaga mimivirus Kroon TaxID=3069720 RepID=A0A0G2Y7W1_9VIRU|nr:hypothetical protein QJ850_gp787 [Acanthamoeba polyphaga mimivirus]AKI79912.1 hypothetical protein [Acanthamoeba polyphaga mimivirus Kroon]ALR83744.1 hypothetical protein [Niemeyer virus]
MGDFVFCYGSRNRKRLSKYIKHTKNSYRLYLDNDNYINVKIETRINQKYIVVDFNDSIDFMKFIVRKKIYCRTSHKHSCNSLFYQKNYLKYIVHNKHLDAIKIFYKKFIPIVKSVQKFDLLFDCQFVNIDPEILKYIFKHGNLEDTVSLIIGYIYQCPNITIEFMSDIIFVYKNKLVKILSKNKFLDVDFDKIMINIIIFLVPSLEKDDVEFFNFIIDEFCYLLNDIDETKLNDKQLSLLKIFRSKYEIIDININNIIYRYIVSDFSMQGEEIYFCPNIFKQIIFSLDNINSLKYNIVSDILDYNIVEYMGVICDFIGTNNPKLINDMLTKAKSTEMSQLLIDYGADYEALYESNKFRKCNDCVKTFIEKLIKETIDS